MRIPRVYTPQPIATGQPLTLEEQASVHLARVLRMRLNDTVRLFNGNGGEHTASIIEIGKKHVSLLPDEHSGIDIQSPLQTHIAVGVSKADKMDWIIQKCTELGVNSLYPVITERCDVKMDTERWQKKVERWQDIAISACEQSGRNLIPLVHNVQTFPQWLHETTDLVRCLLHPEGKNAFSSLPVENNLAMIFGPEGGFSDNEITLAQQEGCHITRLGPRVLRAETAPLAALSLAQAQWGDLLE